MATAGGRGAGPEGARWLPGPRTSVRRAPERAAYDRETVESILDEGFVCHLGFCTDAGPVVLPTAYARVGDVVYLHGSVGNAALRTIVDGRTVCLVVTLVDGLVLARSTFHHSINYRSVTLFGIATDITGGAEKESALERIVEHMLPGRTSEARPPTPVELTATRVLGLPIAEASAKVRTGGPKDDVDDLALDVWAGVLPLRLVAAAPVPDPEHPSAAPVPPSIQHRRRWI